MSVNEMGEIVGKRFDFVTVFEAVDSSPNGDPDRENRPREDDISHKGKVTDVCMKRKIRAMMELDGKSLYIARNSVLEDANKMIYDELGVSKKAKKAKKAKKEDVEESEQEDSFDPDQDKKLRSAFCRRYIDARWFGGVPCSEKFPIGRIHGPVQMSNAFSVEPIEIVETCMTRMAKSNDKDKDKASQGFGRRFAVRYGLYMATGSISPYKADSTGMTYGEVEKLWEYLHLMWNDDRSTSRSNIRPVALFVFEHTSKLGNCPWQDLAERVKVVRNDSVSDPTSFRDYNIFVDEAGMPDGVSVKRKF